jgi:SPP1 gp7 family putative phage head morphogenesis protein
MSYWANRFAKAQAAISEKSLKAIEKQMKKYYAATAKRVIQDFEDTYNKILARQEEGKEVTPADLYKLDKYWQMQAQIRQEMQKLGDKQIALLTKEFETNYFEVYYSLNIDGMKAFTTIDRPSVRQMINSIWVADGKTFSQRVWGNTSRLLATLNEELINCVTAGKKTSQLKQALMERFNISYRRADTLARTELCHIQTQAAKQRYQDYGIQEVEVLVDPDNRTCELCKELQGKRFPTSGTPPLPVHPNERCALVPVVEIT